MSADDEDVEPDPRAISVEPRWQRTRMPIRYGLRFGLRTVFVLLLFACVALTIAYYSIFKPRAALRGPTLWLHANDLVSLNRTATLPLSKESLERLLDTAIQRYRTARGEAAGSLKREQTFSWQRAYGPSLTLIVNMEATHGALNSLLHTCVQHEFERLDDAADGSRAFSFVLFDDLSCEGIPDSCMLPPVILEMRAAEDGSLRSMSVYDRHFRSYTELRRFLIDVIGAERDPDSIQAAIELQMHCDPNLKIRHVFDARDTVAGYKTKDGKWLALVDRIRPVSWGTGTLSIEEVECGCEALIPADKIVCSSNGCANAW